MNIMQMFKDVVNPPIIDEGYSVRDAGGLRLEFGSKITTPAHKVLAALHHDGELADYDLALRSGIPLEDVRILADDTRIICRPEGEASSEHVFLKLERV